MSDSDDDISLASSASDDFETIKKPKKEKVLSSKDKKVTDKKAKVESKAAAKSSSGPPQSCASSGAVPSITKDCSTSSSSITSTIDITRGPDITTESAAKKLIFAYLKRQNRPYSAIQIHDNLHKRIQKPTVERCLAAMCEQAGGLVCKEYGKAKIYFPDQSTLASSCSLSEMCELDLTISSTSSLVENLEQEEKKKRSYFEMLRKEPTDPDLDSVLSSATERLAEKEGRGGRVAVRIDPKRIEQTVKAHNKARATWRDRKNKCLEVVDIISDGMGKKSKVIMGEMGIETDEDCSVFLPEVVVDSSSRSNHK